VRDAQAWIGFDVVGVPGEVALEAVLDVRGRFELVEFAGIDDEFVVRRGALGPEDLFAAENGNVPIDFAAHEKRGRGDVATL